MAVWGLTEFSSDSSDDFTRLFLLLHFLYSHFAVSGVSLPLSVHFGSRLYMPEF